MKKIAILIPIYNDWESASKLIEEINSNILNLNYKFLVFIINDASSEVQSLYCPNTENIKSIKLINMTENKGHTRCIASGLKYIFEKVEFDCIIPMDGDGEDRPEEIKNFLEHLIYNPDRPIVGDREKRSENIIFKTSYFFHKVITFAFAGQSIKFGNYTCLPKSTVKKMIKEKATWSSFSGSLQKVEKNKTSCKSIRGTRYFGPSKMSFLNLIKHSLSIISVFRRNVLIRSIFFLIVYFFLIYKNISIITLIPLYLVILLNLFSLYFANRENMDEYNKSLQNIQNIDALK